MIGVIFLCISLLEREWPFYVNVKRFFESCQSLVDNIMDPMDSQFSDSYLEIVPRAMELAPGLELGPSPSLTFFPGLELGPSPSLIWLPGLELEPSPAIGPIGFPKLPPPSPNFFPGLADTRLTRINPIKVTLKSFIFAVCNVN